MLKIFRELYKLTRKEQRRREKKWLGALQRFANKLAKRRKGVLRLPGIELDLYKIVTGSDMAKELVDKLHHYPSYGLTDDEWREVYGFNMGVDKRAEGVLGGEMNLNCASLMKELNGIQFFFPFSSRFYFLICKLTSPSCTRFPFIS